VERGNKDFFSPQIINLQEGPTLSRTRGVPCTAVTAEKSFFGVGFGLFWLVVFIFFPSEGSLPAKSSSTAPSQPIHHIGRNHSFSSAALCRKSGSHVLQKAKPRPKPAGIDWDNITSVLLLHGKSVALVQTPTFGSFQDLSSFLAALLAAGIMKPSLIWKCGQHIFIFGSPKGIVRPACCRQRKFRLRGTLWTREQKKHFE